MDHLAMKQAMINALEHKITQLENNLNYNIIIANDNGLVADALADCLKLFLSGNYTAEDTEHANEVLKIWRNNRVDCCEECAEQYGDKESN
jgi:hypothetical protein